MRSFANVIRVVISRRVRWRGHVAVEGEMRNAYKILVGEVDGKRPSRKPRSRREANIKMDLKEIWWDVVGWIRLAQDNGQWWVLVKTVKNILCL
jgi:hypothetical protein